MTFIASVSSSAGVSPLPSIVPGRDAFCVLEQTSRGFRVAGQHVRLPEHRRQFGARFRSLELDLASWSRFLRRFATAALARAARPARRGLELARLAAPFPPTSPAIEQRLSEKQQASAGRDSLAARS
jgi:hypothetical protein